MILPREDSRIPVLTFDFLPHCDVLKVQGLGECCHVFFKATTMMLKLRSAEETIKGEDSDHEAFDAVLASVHERVIYDILKRLV